MLTNEEIKIIKETVPLLKDEGQNITSIFIKGYLKSIQN